MSLSPWDDFPLHQAAEFIAHPATSDRNFYDRYYFNLFSKNENFFAIFGYGQYPNLGTTDAFIDVRLGDTQHIVRASKPLVDRSDLSVGPFRVEVLRPLHTLRFIIEDNEHGVAMDATFEGHIPAIEEPRQYIRKAGRVVFDTQRLAQTGNWSGTISIDGVDYSAAGLGSRDRSWGVRPVGEPETDGIRQGVLVLPGMWNYYPMQFDDHSIFYICHEDNDGVRHLVQSERVWCDPEREIDELGPARFEHTFESGTRVMTHSTIHFDQVGISISCSPIVTNYVSLGTGYGIDADWRHGMYQGPELVVQGLNLEVEAIKGLAQYGIVDHAAEFRYGDHVGYGLLEHGFFGPFDKVGMTDGGMGAP